MFRMFHVQVQPLLYMGYVALHRFPLEAALLVRIQLQFVDHLAHVPLAPQIRAGIILAKVFDRSAIHNACHHTSILGFPWCLVQL